MHVIDVKHTVHSLESCPVWIKIRFVVNNTERDIHIADTYLFLHVLDIKVLFANIPTHVYCKHPWGLTKKGKKN